jgi:hypothetical protein
LIALVATLSIGACKPTERKIDDIIYIKNKIILGKFYLSNDLNNFNIINKYYFIDQKNIHMRPEFYFQSIGSVIFHYYHFNDISDFNSKYILNRCDVRELEVADFASDDFRELRIRCDSFGRNEKDSYIFGSKGNLHDIRGYNFRLFGKGLKRLRFTDQDGITLYFVRQDYPYPSG